MDSYTIRVSEQLRETGDNAEVFSLWKNGKFMIW